MTNTFTNTSSECLDSGYDCISNKQVLQRQQAQAPLRSVDPRALGSPRTFCVISSLQFPHPLQHGHSLSVRLLYFKIGFQSALSSRPNLSGQGVPPFLVRSWAPDLPTCHGSLGYREEPVIQVFRKNSLPPPSLSFQQRAAFLAMLQVAPACHQDAVGVVPLRRSLGGATWRKI